MIESKRLNLILGNGLCVLHVKFRTNSSLATLFITDYEYSTRVLFDIEQKCILTNRDNIELTAKDIENLLAAMKPKEKESV